MHRLVGVLLFLAAAAAFAQSAETRLFEAIDDGKPLVAEGILSRSKVDVNALNKQRETLLHRGVEKGMMEVVQTLLRMGARPNARSTSCTSCAPITSTRSPSVRAAVSMVGRSASVSLLRGFHTIATLERVGIVSRSNSSRLPYRSAPVEIVKPVTLPPG